MSSALSLVRRLAAAGPEEIFAGAVARDLAADLSDVGSIVAGEDLAAVEARIAPPIGIAWRGFEVRQTPQPSMGFAMLQMLRIVEGFDLAALGWGSAALVHLMVEAKKRAFLDREAEAGREAPDFAGLLADARRDAHRAAIGDRAAKLPVRAMAETDTTYFCVVDAEGNAVSAIQSINGAFGSGVTGPRSGILLNNRMSYWHLEDGHANQLAPVLVGKHPEKLALARDIETTGIDDARRRGRVFDVVVEASGSASGFQLALDLLVPQGTLVLKSTFHGATPVDAARLVVEELHVIGSRCGRFAPALELLARGAVSVMPLVSETLPLDRATAAMQRAQAPGILKVLLSR